MALTKIGGIAEIGTAIAHHGLLTYIGTNLGNLYSMVNSTGVTTLLDGVNEKIVSIVIEHPTIWVSTSKGNVYSYAITVSGDLPASQSIGSQANTAGSGVPLSSSYPGAFRVFSDDGGANIGTSARGVQSRTLLTVDQSAGTIRALQGQLKLAAGVDVTTGIYTAVQGYVELVGTHICKTGATFSAFDASLEIGTGITVDSGGELFGVHIETTGSGAITNNGVCGAIGITAAGGAAAWPVGIVMHAGSVLQGIQIGASTSAPVVSASTGTTNMVEINSKLTAASGILRGLVSHAEFSGTHVDVATNLYAIRGYAKVSGTVGAGNVLYSAGVQGKLELSGTIGGGKHCAVLAQLNSSAGLTGATGGTVYCLWADGMQVSQTPAAELNMTAIGIELPDAATRFDSAIYIYGGASYMLDIAGEGVGGSYAATWNQAPGAATGSLKIRVGSTDLYLLLTSDPTA